MLEVKHIKKIYPNAGGRRALRDVSFTLPQGEIVGLFGENGAGKTTLMKAVLGLISFQGEVTLDGAPVSHRNIARMSYATNEHSFFPNLSAKAHRQFYEEHFPAFRRRRYEALMEFFHLPENRPIRVFSTGQKNQFEVIMALCQGADYIFMDEPFAGNDIFNREDFYKVLLGILEPSETILLSTHLIEEVADFIGRAVLLREGEIVGDADMEELEDSGRTVMDFIRETYHYQPDRVGKALEKLAGEDGEGLP